MSPVAVPAVPGDRTQSETAAAWVLVVDATNGKLTQIETALRASGFGVGRVDSAAEAMMQRASRPFDALIIGLADVSSAALSAIASLRDDGRLSQAIRIALVPDRSVVAAIGQAFDFGADDVMRWPGAADELLARLRAALDRRRQSAALQHRASQLEVENQRLERLAVRDALTGLYNRRHLEYRLVEEIERAGRYGQPISAILADVDHFKAVNDRHGHSLGDGVLRAVAAVLSSAVRRVDVVARFGGEEFVILAPATAAAGAHILAERIRVTLAAAPLLATSGSGVHATFRVTASFGVATFSNLAHDCSVAAADLIERADAALYRAKQQGRNRVCVDRDETDPTQDPSRR